MSEDKNKNNKKDVAAVISLAVALLPIVKPVIDAVHDEINKVADERKELVKIPELYHKGYEFPVDRAAKLLEESGLKYEIVKLSIEEAKAKYRDCTDLQVIETYPKANQKVKPGSCVSIKYITQDVIDESKRIYEDLIQQKKEKKEKTRQNVAGKLNNAKNGIKKIPSKFAKKKGEQDE